MAKSQARKIRRVTGRIFVLVIVLVGFYFLVKPLAKVDYSIANLEKRSKVLDDKIADIRTKINEIEFELKTSDATYEYKARQKLQMVRNGETIYICKDNEGNDILSASNLKLKEAGEDKKNPLSLVWDWILSLFR
jgi:cell division protein FtsB